MVFLGYLRQIFSFILFLAALFFCPMILKGEELTEKHPVTASFYLEPFNQSETSYAVVRFEIDKDWHLYWINPGDSGLPIEVVWNLPAGLTIGKTYYPTPQKIVSENEITFGYKSAAVIVFELRRSAPISNADRFLKVTVDWLACKESCVRGEKSFELDLFSIPPQQKLTTEMINSAMNLMAKRPDEHQYRIEDPSIEIEKGTIKIGFNVIGKNNTTITDFYPEPIEDFTIDHQGIALFGNRVVIPATPNSQKSRLSTLRGLIIDELGSYEIDIQFRQ